MISLYIFSKSIVIDRLNETIGKLNRHFKKLQFEILSDEENFETRKHFLEPIQFGKTELRTCFSLYKIILNVLKGEITKCSPYLGNQHSTSNQPILSLQIVNMPVKSGLFVNFLSKTQ